MSSSTDTKVDASPAREFDDDVVMTFPQKMMEILSEDENNDAITWLPHGKGFIIYNKKKFATKVMPRYFKQSKFTSFTRKLNRWGFVRVTQRGPEMGAYYHKFFQRDNPTLCLRMTCETAKPPPKPDSGSSMMFSSSSQNTAASSLAMMPPSSTSQLYPSMSNEAALLAQNSLLQQQLLLRIEHERAMSNLYLQMLQNKGASGAMPAASSMTMMNPNMLDSSLTSHLAAEAAAVQLNNAAEVAAAQLNNNAAANTEAKPSANRKNDIRKAKAA